MIVNMSRNATQEQIDHVVERIKECGYQAHVIRGAERTVIGAVGSGGRADAALRAQVHIGVMKSRGPAQQVEPGDSGPRGVCDADRHDRWTDELGGQHQLRERAPAAAIGP